MAVDTGIINTHLPFLPPELRAEISNHSQLAEVGPSTTLLQPGQFVRVIPIVLEGLVKVFTQTGDKELLLYFIRPSESCVMSFSAVINNDKSRIYAKTERESLLLLLPSDRLQAWVREYPRLNTLFFQQYNQRYRELIDTIHELLFNRLDQRLLHYLQELSRVNGSGLIQLKHRQMAQDLGTAREVVTRTLKKLETEGHIRQTGEGIELVRM